LNGHNPKQHPAHESPNVSTEHRGCLVGKQHLVEELQRSVGPLPHRQVSAQLREGGSEKRPVLQHLQRLSVPDPDHDQRRRAHPHITDTDQLYEGIKNGKLPAMSFVKPSGWVPQALCVSATSVSSPIAVALHFYPSVSTSCNPPPSSPQAQSPTPEDGEVLSTSSPTSPMDLSSMRRSPDHLAATDRHPDRSAFSTSSPRESLMKHSSSLRQCFGLSASSPSVCLSGPTLHIYSFCIASYPGHLRSHHSSHLGSPP